MPDSAIIPVLTYSDIDEAIAWLTDSFGFEERWRINNHRAQLSYGNGAIVVTEGASKNSVALLVRVKNIDDHFAKSKSKDAKIIYGPIDQFYGERQYTTEDIGGHLWTFSQTIRSDPRGMGSNIEVWINGRCRHNRQTHNFDPGFRIGGSF
jgi:uncharacterized glyoxalase superfamily protein PhnB